MLMHFNAITPVDMIFKSDINGDITPVRFRIGIAGEGNQVCNITGYRQIKPAGETVTPEGVYLGRNIICYSASFSTEYGTQHSARIYYFKDDTVWGISRLQ
jgi:hypothetical protein